jgi:hypothetical protein
LGTGGVWILLGTGGVWILWGTGGVWRLWETGGGGEEDGETLPCGLCGEGGDF